MPKLPHVALERNVESRIVRGAKFMGLRVEKTAIGGGFPDRMFLGDRGFVAFVEIKRPGRKPRRLQAFRIMKLVEAGHMAWWTDDADYAINRLREDYATWLTMARGRNTDYRGGCEETGARIIRSVRRARSISDGGG